MVEAAHNANIGALGRNRARQRDGSAAIAV